MVIFKVTWNLKNNFMPIINRSFLKGLWHIVKKIEINSENGLIISILVKKN